MPFSRSNAPYDTLGTTPPMFLPRDGSPTPVRAGRDYFFVQVHAAQAVFRGSIFTNAKSLIIASRVSVNRPGIVKDSLHSIQRSRAISPNTAESLGIRSNLIDLVPAVMSDFSISIDFLVDQQDRLAPLSALINDDTFQSVLSFAPGAGMIAKTVSSFARRMIETFVPMDEQLPILEFTADFNLASDDVADGYYVILGSRHEANPLPRPLPQAVVRDGELLLDGQPVTQYSYVVLDIRRVPVRTRGLNDGAPWETKLREAEDEAQLPAGDTNSSWEKCRGLLREAQTLLRADPNYLRDEADAIILSALSTCKRRLYLDEQTRGKATVAAAGKVTAKDLKTIALPADLNVPEVLSGYADDVMAAREQIAALNIDREP
jgi:hypothetical protein